MISTVRTTREQPSWIVDTIWDVMVAYWDTEEAQQRSQTYSSARMSDRKGLGPHVHFSGPKSFQQIQYEMEQKMGRPVSLGELFVKTHTKPDGSYVDRKAEKVGETYEKNVQDKLAELQADTSALSDAASPPRELTVDEMTTIFLQSTEMDSRGIPYGVGSLKDSLVNGKLNHPGNSTSFLALEEQLKEAQRKIEEQVAYNAKRDAEVVARESEQARVVAEHSRAMAEQKGQIEHLTMVAEYLRENDPRFLDFMASKSAAVAQPSSTSVHQPAQPTTPSPP
ncbi:uncharacterized protein LOC111828842 [Capsella rubella]|uniref:uncharacterized protein LOC111828842 n=1 Tax=Capsella rubella TaxID=81985 RepID=UPI000CD4EB35|nr:uncharacterized protein LOC111828842 [Capsella rubella]